MRSFPIDEFFNLIVAHSGMSWEEPKNDGNLALAGIDFVIDISI